MDFLMQWLGRHFELSRDGQAPGLKSMEGLRGYAVFLVFVVHYVSLFKFLVPEDDWIFSVGAMLQVVGNTGVDLFFVLSGYLIYGTLIEKRPLYGVYFRRRVRRIYPVFIVVFVLYVVLSYVYPSESKIPDSFQGAVIYLALNLLLLPGLLPVEPMITVAWSLSYELFYYLMIPVIIEIFGLRAMAPFRRLIFFLFVLLFVLVGCSLFGGPIRMAMFLSGVLLFDVIKIGWRLRFPSFFGLFALVSAQVFPLLPVVAELGGVVKLGILFVSFFVLCLACFQDERERIFRVFAWSPIRWLGNMSYSYYLIHGLALKALFMVLPMIFSGAMFGVWFFLWFMLVAFFLTLIPSILLFLAVERPFSLVGGRSLKSG